MAEKPLRIADSRNRVHFMPTPRRRIGFQVRAAQVTPGQRLVRHQEMPSAVNSLSLLGKSRK